jgi:hypothetical protein
MCVANRFCILSFVLFIFGSCIYTDSTSPSKTAVLTLPNKLKIDLNKECGIIEQLNETNSLKKVRVSFSSLKGGESFLFGIIPVGGSDPMQYKSLKIYDGKELHSQLSLEDILSNDTIIFGLDTIFISLEKND